MSGTVSPERRAAHRGFRQPRVILITGKLMHKVWQAKKYIYTVISCLLGKPVRGIECESDATKFNNNKPVIYPLPLPLETCTA